MNEFGELAGHFCGVKQRLFGAGAGVDAIELDSVGIFPAVPERFGFADPVGGKGGGIDVLIDVLVREARLQLPVGVVHRFGEGIGDADCGGEDGKCDKRGSAVGQCRWPKEIPHRSIIGVSGRLLVGV